jgi:hypothetical protein
MTITETWLSRPITRDARHGPDQKPQREKGKPLDVLSDVDVADRSRVGNHNGLALIG